MSIDGRLTRLSPRLSAKERGILVLGSLKYGTPEDPAWRHSMPSGQAAEFSRYIGLMNAANMQLSHLVTFIEGEVEKLDLKLTLWFTLHLWQMNLAEIAYAAAIVAREAVTESEYRRKQEEAARQYLPVASLAVLLATEQRSWTDDELEPLHDTTELVVKDAAWARLKREAEGDIRAAVAAGKLEARGDGKKLTVRCGSFDAWLGKPLTVTPDWAEGYEVRPDAQQARVAADRGHLAYLRSVIATTPLDRMPGGAIREETTLPNLIEAIAGQLTHGIALRWNDIRAVEMMLDEIGAEFDGEDPLKPRTREALDRAKERLLWMVRQVEVSGGPIELTEPAEADREEMRALVEKGRKLLS